MPTVKRPAWDAGSLECGDLYADRSEQGTNRWGRPSHATRSYYGSKGWVQYGFRSAGWWNQSPAWSIYTSATPSDVVEGAHEGNLWTVFRDLGVPQGATITDARLHLTPSDCGDPPSGVQPDSEWRLKLYGLAEDDAFPGRTINTAIGYDWDWHHRYHGHGYLGWAHPSIGIPHEPSFRLRSGSVEYDREHTAAKVNWRWVPAARPGALDTEWSSPNIAAVIQEIVTRPGWSPNNKLSVVLAVDDMFPGVHLPDTFDPASFDDYYGPGQWFIRWAGVRFTTKTKRPHLTVTW